MSSENLFEEDFSEEIITELEQEYVGESLNNVEQDEANEEEYQHNQETVNIANEKINDSESNILQKNSTQCDSDTKLFQLPLTRIRNIMKLDPDLNIASNEAVFLVTRATELFIESLAQESFTFTAEAKKKTVQKGHVDSAIEAVDSLMFLDGAMAF